MAQRLLTAGIAVALAANLHAQTTIATSDTPDFGPDVRIFDPKTPSATIQAALDAAFD